MTLASGVLGVVAAFAAIAYFQLGFFTSGGGVIIASVIAHAVGTGVATLHADWSRNAGRLVLRVVARTLIYVVVVLATYRLLINLTPRFIVSATGLISASAIAYVVGTAVASLVQSMWKRDAALLALLVFALATTYFMVASTPGAGGPNSGPNVYSPDPR